MPHRELTVVSYEEEAVSTSSQISQRCSKPRRWWAGNRDGVSQTESSGSTHMLPETLSLGDLHLYMR